MGIRPQEIYEYCPYQEIRELKSLFDDSVITEEEFETRKHHLLSLPIHGSQPASPAIDGRGYDEFAGSESIGWWFLGFLLPPASLIMWAILNRAQPNNAGEATRGALWSIGFVTVFALLVAALYFLLRKNLLPVV